MDTINKVKRVSEDICRLKSVRLDDTLMFLLKWNTLTVDQKNKKYNDYQCHEVNLFLYFKDREYFTLVAKPFISSKMEKTFIDYWLLGDEEEIMHFQEVTEFDKLNALEQSLLVFNVAKRDKEHALALANRIKLASDANSKHIPVETNNKIFDTVLALNLLQEDSEKLEMMNALRDQIKQEESLERKFMAYSKPMKDEE